MSEEDGGGGGGGAKPAGGGYSNFKGVMLCNRPPPIAEPPTLKQVVG